MATEIFGNAGLTTLNGAINNSVTSVVVTAGSVFPTTGNFRIVCESEIMLCTARSSNTLTVVRGYESTTAASHADLTPIAHILTAGSFTQWLQDRGIVAQAIGDRKPDSPGTYDEEFDGVADTVPTNWSWASAPSGSDATYINSRWPSILMVEGTGNTAYTLTRGSFAPGSIDFGVWFKVFAGPVVGNDNPNVRIKVGNSGHTEQRTWELNGNGSNLGFDMRSLQKISNSETLWGSARSAEICTTQFWGGITRTSGNIWKTWFSSNGLVFNQLGAASSSHSFTVANIDIEIKTTSIFTMFGLDYLRYRTDLEFPRY